MAVNCYSRGLPNVSSDEVDSTTQQTLRGWGGVIETVALGDANVDFNSKDQIHFYERVTSFPFTPELLLTYVGNYVSPGNYVQAACYIYASIDIVDGLVIPSDTLIIHNRSDSIPITGKGRVYCSGGVGTLDKINNLFVLGIVMTGTGNSQLAMQNTGRSDAYVNWVVAGKVFPDTIILPVGSRIPTNQRVHLKLLGNQ
jgi:hypothetical protein